MKHCIFRDEYTGTNYVIPTAGIREFQDHLRVDPPAKLPEWAKVIDDYSAVLAGPTELAGSVLTFDAAG